MDKQELLDELRTVVSKIDGLAGNALELIEELEYRPSYYDSEQESELQESLIELQDIITEYQVLKRYI